MANHTILGVHVLDRTKGAAQVQQLFTQYGRHIRTRLGLHDVNGESPSPAGLILLELVGDADACKALREQLTAIDGIEVQEMIFEH